ncbi:MAG TPA: hypothetical protein VGH67_04360 [Solirubrobacteraceae bacterium]|jgi:hypothetical protein
MTITTQEIPREAWRSYFEELNDVLGTVEATVGREAPDSEVERIEHVIEQPRRGLVAAGESPPLEVTFDIEDPEQHQRLIHLERPPGLPAG